MSHIEIINKLPQNRKVVEVLLKHSTIAVYLKFLNGIDVINQKFVYTANRN